LKAEILRNKPELITFLSLNSNSDSVKLRPKVTKRSDEGLNLLSSFAQQRLWFIDQLQGGSAEYNMPAALQIDGDFDVDAAEQAITRIIARHETLRTVFKAEGDNTLQIIQSKFEFKLIRHDLSQLDETEQQANVKALILDNSLKTFDLSQDLMVRASYLHLSTPAKPKQDILLFNLHHIASDGWSIGVLLDEFVTQYQAIIEGKPDPLSPLPIQYADYAHWQRRWLIGEVLEGQLAYWTKQLNEVPAVHSLPLDYPRPKIKGHQGAVVTTHLDAHLAQRLQQIASDSQLTPFMLLHAGLALVLSRHSNSHDIVVGTPMANRMQVELKSLIGFFANTLVLRVDTRHDTLADYLTHIRSVNLAAQAHQDIPFEQLVDRCKVPRSSQYAPLFQVTFSMNTSEQSDLVIAGINFTPIGGAEVVAKFDLDINAQVTEEGIDFSWVYDTSLFTQAHIEVLSEHLNRLLIGIAEAPDSKLCDLQMLSKDEIKHLIFELNDTKTDHPEDKLIHELFEAQVKKTPANIAVVFQDVQLSYLQLNQRANQLARHLIELGVKPDDIVGICVERSEEMLVGILAILKAGGAYLPLEPDYPSARLNHILDDSKAKTLVIQQELISLFSLQKQNIVNLNDSQCFSQYSVKNLDSSAIGLTAEHLAYVIYTSGSSGAPKGVMIEHKAIAVHARLWSKHLNLTAQDRIIQFASISFDGAPESIFSSLQAGASLFIREQVIWGVSEFYQYCLDNRITVVDLPPAYCLQLLQTQTKSIQNFWNQDNLRLLVLGGDTFNQEIISLWNRFDTNCRLINAYGPTEATVTATTYELHNYSSESSVPIGKALPERELYILHKNGLLVPSGCVGELCIGGQCLARGYLNSPELTDELFIPNRFSDDPNGRLYKTGDLVRYLPDGNLEFIGRIDDQVKIRGFRIELNEIQQLLSESLLISSCLVLAREDKTGQKQLVAYVVTANETDLATSDLTGQLRKALQINLPDYMVPSSFVLMDEWPLTANGKIDKKALPEVDGTLLQGEYIAPATDTEQTLVQIWANLLKLRQNAISVTANFFELGGHSLLLVRLLSTVEQATSVKFDLRQIYINASIRGMAELIDYYNSSYQFNRSMKQEKNEELERVEF